MQGQEAAVRIDLVGDVMVLVLTHPPVNALSDAVRGALQAGLRAGLGDPEVQAIVLRGEGRGFSAGADISEFGKPRQTARLGDLCLEIENAGKPVIAAIHGMALGGGLELALAAHYRIANAQAMLGLPEVNLGLLPGAGGTQRLPRLVGAKEALRVMLTGVPISASEALALGLVDRVVESGLTEAAIAMAGEGLQPRPTGAARQGMTDMAGYLAAVNAARAAQKGNRLPAAARIVDCVEAAALFPLQQGLYAEEAAFADLVATPEAAGLRYAFFTERRAMMPPQSVAAKGVGPIATIGIWGVDDIAADLAFQALSAGMRVVFAAEDRAALVAALERMAARQEQAVVAGQLSEDARDADWARLTTSMSVEPLKSAELVLMVAGATPMTQGQIDVPLAALGSAQDGLDVGLTMPFAAGGLAELSMSQLAKSEVVARVLAMARRVNWRVVFTGPNGPVELGLRQALAAAVADLESQGEAAVTAALTAFGMGTGARAALPAMPRGGAVIISACLAAMAAEGARMLVDGRARRPLEIDAVAMMSGLMPRWEGGPMFQADQRGLLVVRQELLKRATQSPVFQVPILIDDLIADGKTFASLNG